MDEFNFYNNENDGYRGGLGGYTDPEPSTPATPFQTGPQPPKRKKGGAGKVIALVLACTIAGGGAGVGGAYLYNRMAGLQNSTTIYEEDRPQVRTVVNTNNGQPMTPEQLYAANLASCVGITVNTTVNIFGQTTTSAASGSGFVLSQDGYIATNYHVIEEAAEDDTGAVTIEVSFANGDKYDARLIGGEKDNDVAVIKIDADDLTPVTLGDSSKLVVGEAVYAIGNPLGEELRGTMTDGIVSAIDRPVRMDDGTDMSLIQTTAALNSGNSGGALINAAGQVVGITNMKMMDEEETIEGLGFAIPTATAKEVVDHIIALGFYPGRPMLGITVSNRSRELGLPAGAYVEAVDANSNAYAQGIRPGDVLTRAGEVELNNIWDLENAKAGLGVGDVLTLEVWTDGETWTVEVTLAGSSSLTD